MLWMHDNVRLVRTSQREVLECGNVATQHPHVRTPAKTMIPRVMAIAQDFLGAVGYHYSDHAFQLYMEAFQTATALNMGELSLLVPALKLALLEELGSRVPIRCSRIQNRHVTGDQRSVSAVCAIPAKRPGKSCWSL